MGRGDSIQAHAVRTGPVRDAARFRHARLLLVDDNVSNVALLKAIFAREGFRNLFTETDPRQVLPRLAGIDPDLVILDLHMPHLDGFEVLAQIRQFASDEALPVLVLTADTTPAASERALDSGAQDFVTKPFLNGEVLVRSYNLLRTRFLHTSLRNSVLREIEATAQQRRLSSALALEQQSADRMRILDGMKDTLLQTVSHDLRNPIWAVMLLTDLLAADTEGSAPLTAEARLTIIDKVQRSANQMESLLSDILDSDPMRPWEGAGRSCDVAEVVNRVLAELDLGQNHPLEVDIDHVMANIDPAHLERIVHNLLSNAHQHLSPGIGIWVTVAEVDGEVMISVDDAGVGVAPAIAHSIFEPFRRGPTSATGGLGLGLSLVARFAQLHGGRAWAQERPGGGASFRVVIPATHTLDPVQQVIA